MRRDCGFTVEVNKLQELRSYLEEVAQQQVPGRWCPKYPTDWTDVWTSARDCLDMAQARAYELNLFQEEESLAKLRMLLLVATLKVCGSSVDEAGNIPVRCETEDYKPRAWSNYQQSVGSYHADQLRAAAIDLGRLLSLVSKEKWTEEKRWINLAVAHFEYMYLEARRNC